jgi:hypothetical protein
MNPTKLVSYFLELWIFRYKFVKFELNSKPNEK